MSVYEQLFDWQKKIVDKVQLRTSYGLFLDMGLGKTPIALALAEQNHCDKIIVVTLSSKAEETAEIRGSWFWWSCYLEKPHRPLNKKNTVFTSGREIFVTNYESLYQRYKPDQEPKTRKSRKPPIILKQQIKDFINSCKGQSVALIVDESHYIKNTSSSRTKALEKVHERLSLVSTRLYTYLLTGTPFTVGYEDLFSQLKILGYNATKTSFIDQFCERGNVRGLLGWQQPIVGYKNIDQLFDTVHKHAITLDSKEIPDLKLPPQIFVDYTTPASQAFKMFSTEKVHGNEIVKYADDLGVDLQGDYNTLTKINNPFFRDIDCPASRWIALTSGSAWLRARQLSIGFQGNENEAKWFDRSRLNQVKTFLEQNPDNYVLFYNFTAELLELYSICERLRYNIDVFCGGIKSLVFYQRYEEQKPNQRLTNTKNIILANYASGSAGKNWQLYNKCILFSIPTYDDYKQGLKRVHRIGADITKPVIYHRFYQNNWLDQAMLDCLEKRSNYTERLFENQFNEKKQFDYSSEET